MDTQPVSMDRPLFPHVGFDTAVAPRDAVHGKSVGLLSMEERVRLVGGTFHLQSTPGVDTSLMVRFPRWLRDEGADNS